MGKNLPSFTGLSWQHNPYYSFFIPINWQRLDWPDGRSGVIYLPTADDPLTLFAVDMRDLETLLTPEDCEDLVDGFLSGIQALPDCQIESQDHWVVGDLIGMEARYTFTDQGGPRKRWVRQFYHETRQIAMIAQGATPEHFAYWLPMFYEAMMTTKIHNSLPNLEAAW
ncbi:MAG: hypothetical protein K8J31_15035 [Anaerolineae bacterium]|nr:hypothetical protein [Anaerolineae bacterium]